MIIRILHIIGILSMLLGIFMIYNQMSSGFAVAMIGVICRSLELT